MPKNQNVFVAWMVQLVVRHTFNSTVNEFETAGRDHNAIIESFRYPVYRIIVTR
jgi:hypothetical protein